MTKCEFLEVCGFLKKYLKKYDKLCKIINEDYCNDLNKSKNCAIKKYRLEKGKSPPDELMPNGENVDPFAV